MPEDFSYDTEIKMDEDYFERFNYPLLSTPTRILNNNSNQIHNGQIILPKPIPLQNIRRVATPLRQPNPRVFDALNTSIPVQTEDQLLSYLNQV